MPDNHDAPDYDGQAYHQEGLSFPHESPSAIPENHPLRRLFHALIEKAFLNSLGVYDSQMLGYLADVLTDFTHVRQVYKVRDLAGRPLTEVADMLMHADVGLNALSFNREREVHKHIGDFTLFWTGLYPDALPRLNESHRKDHLIDYVRQGKASYAIAAAHDYGAYREQSPILLRLSEEFELCLLGLNAVRKTMDRMGTC